MQVQLIGLGWQADQLLSLRRAHDLAARRFRGLVRPGGKSFLSHLVGTASIAAYCGANADVTEAALLHAWRTHGVQLLGWRPPRLRGHFSRRLRPEVRALVAAYETLHRRVRREGQTAALNADRADGALLIHLANEVERYVDHGALFVAHYRDDVEHGPDLLQLARFHGYHGLARSLAQALESDRDLFVPPGLVSPESRSRGAG